MDEKLNTLIALLEEEKARLLHFIDHCVKEEEYQLANFHQEALYQVNGRIQTFKNIQDKLYDQKSYLQNLISSFEKMLSANDSILENEFLTREILRQKKELDNLDQLKKPVTNSVNEHLFDDTLHKLIQKKIKSFKLILKKADDLFLAFKYKSNTVEVALPLVKQHIKHFVINVDQIESFRNLGFKLLDHEGKLVLELAGNNEEALDELKIILAKIVFEIFYFKEFENESYIEIEGEGSR